MSHDLFHRVLTAISIEHKLSLSLLSIFSTLSWYHGDITREEAELRLSEQPLQDGVFLVQMSRDATQSVLCEYSDHYF